MNHWLGNISVILYKDLLLEFRSKQVLPTMIVLGMLIVWVMRLIAEAGAMDTRSLGPAALWIAFLFCGLLTQERCFAIEEDQDCMAGLLLSPVDPGSIYLAKLLVNIVVLCIFEIVIVPIVIIVFRLEASGRLIELVTVLVLGNIAISSVGTLFSAMVHISRIRGSLLSVLVLVVMMPMMIPGTCALLIIFDALPQVLVGTGTLAAVGNYNAAIGYLLVFDAVFTTAAWLLFGFIVQE